jgi:FkbM family methyltransferase
MNDKLGPKYFYLGDQKALYVRRNGAKIVLDLRDIGTLNFIASDNYEPDVTRAIASILTPDGTFIDVGANLGIHSIAAWRRMKRSGRVIAIEANPQIFSLMAQTIRLNGAQGCVEAFHAAAWNETGEVSFSSEPDQHRVGAVHLSDAVNYGNETVTVPAIRLDDLELERADLIKIDVEGREPFVIEGGRELIARSMCPIICEYHESVIASTYGVNLFHSLLNELNLSPHRIGPDSFELIGDYPQTHANLVFLPG